ncbi:MAG: DUF4412 domain-containing protein, partial [Desulfobulbaceae bacterium]|nr:DUF4412 domain-containing protein [Desulfobulbaceae bacterium]
MPVICMYEVFKKVNIVADEARALQAVSQMRQGQLIVLSEEIALKAALISIKHKLPMADSLIYATGYFEGAVIWTQDVDSQDLPGVKYKKKEVLMKFVNTIHRSTLTNFFWVALVYFMLAPSSSHALLGAKTENFSADQVMISPDGKVMSTSKLYITPDAYRMDGLPMGGQGGVTRNLTFLGFKKQDKQYIYNHDKKLVFESQLDENGMLEKMKSKENIDSEKILGKEKVSGYKCVKKEVTRTMTMMGTKITITQIEWQNDRFEFPLRIKMEEGPTTEFRNIKKGKPSKKLFKHPKGYKKVDNMMAAMGIDFVAMAGERRASRDKARKSAPQKNINDIDVEEMMASMQQVMGEDADPKQREQFQQIMARAMNQARQINMKKGAANGLW